MNILVRVFSFCIRTRYVLFSSVGGSNSIFAGIFILIIIVISLLFILNGGDDEYFEEYYEKKMRL